jgi:hypothetical protein
MWYLNLFLFWICMSCNTWFWITFNCSFSLKQASVSYFKITVKPLSIIFEGIVGRKWQENIKRGQKHKKITKGSLMPVWKSYLDALFKVKVIPHIDPVCLPMTLNQLLNCWQICTKFGIGFNLKSYCSGLSLVKISAVKSIIFCGT